jgi:hypothetical protein
MSASPAETAPTPPELGHLVEGLDFSGVVGWAKGQDIPPFESTHGMVGSTPVTIDGRSATVGYVRKSGNAPEGGYVNFTPEINVENPGGEDIIVVEGSFGVHVKNSSGMPKREESVRATPQRPRFLQLDGGDKIVLYGAHGPDPDQQAAWYVCFYPEAA